MGCVAGVLSRDKMPVQVLEVLLLCRGDELRNLPKRRRLKPKDVAEELEQPAWRVYAAAKQLRKHGYLVASRRKGRPYEVTEYGIRAMRRHRRRMRGE